MELLEKMSRWCFNAMVIAAMAIVIVLFITLLVEHSRVVLSLLAATGLICASVGIILRLISKVADIAHERL